MGGKIKVDPAQLNTAASQIEQQAGEYQTNFNKLFGEVDGMKSAWQGIDNQAFTDQINGFREDFDMMLKLMQEYAAFLKQASTTYQTAQDETVAAARRLTN